MVNKDGHDEPVTSGPGYTYYKTGAVSFTFRIGNESTFVSAYADNGNAVQDPGEPGDTLTITSEPVGTPSPSTSPQPLPQQSPVLGYRLYAGRDGAGWGRIRPALVSNGGDPAGVVSQLRWSTWGGGQAIGRGKTSAFKPSGGYYGSLVPIVLRASFVGQCHGVLAFNRLQYREAPRPGAAVSSRWRPWSGGSGNICRSLV
jgi:hypothetical protein